MLSGRGLCDELITRPQESYRLWCVVVCDLENLMNEEAMTRWGAVGPKRKKKKYKSFFILIDPYILDYSVEIPTRCSFVIEFIIPKFFKGSTCFERQTAHHQEL